MATTIYDKEKLEYKERGDEYEKIDIEMKLVRSNIYATNAQGKKTYASGIWIHAGKRSAILAEKVVKQLEQDQHRIIDGRRGRILDRNARVMCPPNELDPG